MRAEAKKCARPLHILLLSDSVFPSGLWEEYHLINWYTLFFYKQYFYKQRQTEIDKKIKQMLSNTLRLNFYYLIIIHILHPRRHPDIFWKISKRTSVSAFIRFIIMKIKMKMKNRLHRYNINRSRSGHGRKYGKCKKYLSMMMLVRIKQHLSNIWNSIHEQVKQHWGWVEKKCCL